MKHSNISLFISLTLLTGCAYQQDLSTKTIVKSKVGESPYGELISAELAMDPLVVNEIDKPFGPVKKMDIFHACEPSKCEAIDREWIIHFDSHGRPVKMVFYPDSITNTLRVSQYKTDQDQFPTRSSITIGEKTTHTYFARDQYGNILTINNQPTDYFRTPDGFRAYKDSRKVGLGIENKFYKSGWLVKIETHQAENIMTQEQTVPPTTTLFDYKFRDSGELFSRSETIKQRGSDVFVSHKVYYMEGWLAQTWSSAWGQPKKTAHANVYVNYQVDKHGNWVSRDSCKAGVDWKATDNCWRHKRDIEYYPISKITTK